MELADIKYVKKCKFVVASGIFDGYDLPHEPSNISFSSKKLFCFLMVVDEVSLKFMRKNGTVKEDSAGGKWVGIWRIILLKNPPYDEPRRNGKVPKILTHRLFPEAQYSIWIDGKMELIVDPLLILERYLYLFKYFTPSFSDSSTILNLFFLIKYLNFYALFRKRSQKDERGLGRRHFIFNLIHFMWLSVT